MSVTNVKKTKLVLSALAVAILILLMPYPYSLILAFLAAMLFFASMGGAALVLGLIFSGIILLVPVMFEYAVAHFPWENFMIPHGWTGGWRETGERIPYGFGEAKSETYLSGINEIELLGRNIEIFISKDATSACLEKGLYYRVSASKLEIFSKTGGKVILPPIRTMKVDGMGMKVAGTGIYTDIELNGMNNEVRLELDESFDAQVAGMDNSLELKAKVPGRLEVSGMDNRVKIDLTGATYGTIGVKVSGMDNHVKIYVPKDGSVRVEKEVTPAFSNEVEIIRR